MLVPSPNVAEDHQRKNAEALAQRGAAVMILDRECAEKLPRVVTEMLRDPKKREELGANARKMALENADEKIVDEILKIIKR